MGRRGAVNKPEPVNDRAGAVQRKVGGSSQVGAANSPLLDLQRRAGNGAVVRLLQNAAPQPTVQRIIDDFNEKVPRESLSVSKHFSDRHVATDADDAVQATLWRVDHDPKVPRPMLRGTMANTVAPEATWISALDASSDRIEVGPAQGGKRKGPQVQKGQWQGKSGSGQQKGPTVRFKPASVWQVTYDPVSDDATAVKAEGPDLIAGGLPAAVTRGTKSGQQDLGQSFVLDHISNP